MAHKAKLLDFTATARVFWPQLGDLVLPSDVHAMRRASIGGSDANIIFGGDEDRLLRLWREKRGEEEREPLDRVLQVALGRWTEEFNRQWFEVQTGYQISRVGDLVRCPENEWRHCLLDGYVSRRGAVWEAKHTNAFTSLQDALARYMPQIQHNMAVCSLERAYLSVIFGNHKWELIEVTADWMYQEELLAAEARFIDAVRHGVAPVAVAPPPPPSPVEYREINLEGSNAWSDAAHDWLAHGAAAKIHAGATSRLKGLIEQDVSRAFGHGVEGKRSKSGAITIRELKQ